MKISSNIVQQYVDFALPPVDELVERMNQQLGVAEAVVDVHDMYKDARVVRVVECEKHPDADRLSVCQIDAGTGELVQVVCGAPNVQANMWAVWLPPDSTVPATYDDEVPFILGARKLRGVMSHGMLAAADELAIGSDHEGIIELTERDVRASKTLTPGASFAELCGLDDMVIDIENKMFTHRPDLFGQLGVAREIAGIFGHEFHSPDWYLQTPEPTPVSQGLDLTVTNETTGAAPRIMAVVLDNITVKPSPLWLQCALVAMGGKPINNVVDMTNYVMLLTAQPTHAYDYDKLRGHRLAVRMAQQSESLTLLNGKTYQLDEADIVIADGEGPVGLAGIMGGLESEVTAATTKIVLEVASFDMYAVRKSSMRHGIFTDALTRFNKGQSPFQNEYVLGLLMDLLGQHSGGAQASAIYDAGEQSGQNRSTRQHSLEALRLTSDFINKRLGLELSGATIATLLRNVEFEVEEAGEALAVRAPFWRTDIDEPEDIVEEVGRLYGFDKLPRELPRRSTTPTATNREIEAKQRLREVLSRAGGNEVLTYSFVHEQVLGKALQDATGAFQLSNALSPDLQYYRLSVLPSLLDKVYMNIRAGYDAFMLYEVGKAHHNQSYGDDGLPLEFGRVAGVYADKQSQASAAYYQSKQTIEYTVAKLLPGARVSYARLDSYELPEFQPFRQMIAPFDPVRSAVVEIDGKLAGVVGEFRASVVKNFKLPVQSSGFELFISPFVRDHGTNYQSLSRYPAVQRDLSLRVANEVRYAAVYEALGLDDAHQQGLKIVAEPLAIYQAADSTDQKTITLRLTMTPSDKTLDSAEAAALLDSMIARVTSAVDAQVV